MLGKDGKSDSSDQQRNRSEAPHRNSLRLLGACDFALSIKSLYSEKIFLYDAMMKNGRSG
jgi:hypothetical protein